MTLIQNKIDILDVVQKYLKLKRVGKYFVALCPFHKETKPSFYVSPEKQIFKCFGCGEGGDAIKFLMKIENLSFSQALEKLKEDYGLEIKTSKTKNEDEKELLEINYASLKFFRQKLRENEEALEYLKSRGLKEEIIEKFELGFSPGNTLLRDYLYALGYSLEKIKRAGLLDEKDFDRFQSRIIFPLREENGKLVGFMGRLFGKEFGPKYLNSPETLLFKKSQFLYGLFYSKEYILQTKKVILVEGTFDFILAWQNNLRNIVAISGSALTEDHLRKLKKYTQQIVFAFDNDEAGFSASLRANLLAKKLGFQTFQALYSEKDLADFFLNHSYEEIGEEKFEDYLLETLIKKYGPENKKAVLSIFLPQIKNLKPIEIDEYLDKLSSLLNVSKNLLEEELKQIEVFLPSFQQKELVEEQTLEEKFSLKILSLLYLQKDENIITDLRAFIPLKFKDLLERLLTNELNDEERDYFEMARNFYLNSNISLERELKKSLLNLKWVILKNNLKKLNEKLKLARPEEFDKIILEINEVVKELKRIEKE